MTDHHTQPPRRAWMSWSSGKDSALALNYALQDPKLEITGLLTTVNAEFDRVAMHGVRRALLERQAQALELPLHMVELPWPCSNEQYEQLMAAAITTAQAEGVETMVFGDLFLEDVRAYREQKLEPTGIAAVFPLWQRPTDAIAQELITKQFKAIVTTIDPRQLQCELAGRAYDHEFLNELPDTADPCGENGEFHTVVIGSPDFTAAIDTTLGEIVERDGFIFADVIPN